jgi:transcriptional regulator with XRE-family HTH domain
MKRKPTKPPCSDQELLLREDVSGIICDGLNRLDWTQKFLAGKTGYSQQHISRVLACKVNVSFETIGRLCFTLGVRPVLVLRESDD